MYVFVINNTQTWEYIYIKLNEIHFTQYYDIRRQFMKLNLTRVLKTLDFNYKYLSDIQIKCNFFIDLDNNLFAIKSIYIRDFENIKVYITL